MLWWIAKANEAANAGLCSPRKRTPEPGETATAAPSRRRGMGNTCTLHGSAIPEQLLQADVDDDHGEGRYNIHT